MLDSVFPVISPKPAYEECINKDELNVFKYETVIPMPGISNEPIGMLKNGRFLINEAGVRHISGVWAEMNSFQK